LSNVDVPQDEQAGTTYGELVWRQFRRRGRAVFGLWIVGFLFVLAVFASFIAGNKALVMHKAGTLSFPVLSHLQHQDIFLLLAFFGIVARWVLGRWVLPGKTLPMRMKRRRWTWAIAIAVLGITLGDIAWHTLKSNPRRSIHAPVGLDVDREKGEWAVMPPIPWDYGFTDPDPDIEWPEGPSARHWLGVDDTARDVFSRMIHGARVSLFVGFVSVGIASAIGIVFGSLAGFFRGWVDIVIMRLVEIMMCFPTFFLLLAILAFLPRSIFVIMAVLGVTAWPGTARLIRAEFFKQSGLDYTTAGRALGLSNMRIMFRHLLPNALTPVLVTATFGIAGAILAETALTFLGLGVGADTPSWGEILAEGKSSPLDRWHLVVLPGIAIFINVLAYNLVGDGLRDAIDPRLKV